MLAIGGASAVDGVERRHSATSVAASMSSSSNDRITSPDDRHWPNFASGWPKMAIELDREPRWPAEQLRLCGEYGVYEWFLDPDWGGQGWNDEQIVRGYHALGAACLTTTFIITQRTGACRRIAGCENERLKQRLLPGLGPWRIVCHRGHFASHDQPAAPRQPVLTAEAIAGGFRLHGMSPWVTGGAAADVMVLAASLVERGRDDRSPAVDRRADRHAGSYGRRAAAARGCTASSTGPVHLDGVEVSIEWLIAGPMRHVMASGVGAGTGGYETSTLAIGLAGAAIDYLDDESTRRADLRPPMAALRSRTSSWLTIF